MSFRTLLGLALVVFSSAVSVTACSDAPAPPPPLPSSPESGQRDDVVREGDLSLEIPALLSAPNFVATKTGAELEAVAASIHNDPKMKPLLDALARAGMSRADVDRLARPAALYLSTRDGDLHQKLFEEGRGELSRIQEETISKLQKEAASRGEPLDWSRIEQQTHLLTLTGQRKEVR